MIVNFQNGRSGKKPKNGNVAAEWVAASNRTGGNFARDYAFYDRNEPPIPAFAFLNHWVVGTDTGSRPGNCPGISCFCGRGFSRLDRDLDSHTGTLVDCGHGHRVVGLFEILQWTLVA